MSGNGTVGGTDTEIRMLIGPEDTGFPAAFVAADFANARTGPPAEVVTPQAGSWITSLPSFPAAQWISTDPTPISGNSVLFAIPFVIPAGALNTAVLTVWYAVDNSLGNTTNAGVYLNEVPVPGFPAGSFTSEFTSGPIDVSAWLTAGTNWLYIYQHDSGSHAGLLFGAELEYGCGTQYCLSSANSSGSAATISASGCSMSAANFTLDAGPLPDQPFLFMHSSNQVQVPFGNGYLCVGSPVTMMHPPGVATGNYASLSIDPAAHGFAPGTYHFQCWFRDPLAGGLYFNTSDATTVVFVP